MDNQSFASLRDRCFGLVKSELKERFNGQLLDELMALSLQHGLLRATELAVETYKGIIGYRNWLRTEGVDADHFIEDALHDLYEAVKYRREDDGYCPRTSQYVEFYNNDYQIFETPAEIADYIVELADIKPTDKVLEPSAGRGALVRAIHRVHPEIVVDGCELMDLNVSYLSKLNNFRLVGRDFLTDSADKYNVIVAHPPFSKNQDVNHILKMETQLHPGGRLVTVASNHWQHAQGKKELMFRSWLDTKGATVHPLDSGTFKESGTMVGACIIRIRK